MTKFTVSLFIAVISMSCTSFAKGITLIVKAPFLTPESDSLYVTHAGKNCAWQPQCQQLKKIGDRLYKTSLKATDTEVFIKITRGSWNTEAADISGKALNNIKIGTNQDRVVLNLANWKDLGNHSSQKNKRIIKIDNFLFPSLGYAKTVYVYLPPQYKEASQVRLIKKYPVIYAHDGNNLFFAQDSTFGSIWDLANTMDDLIRREEIPPVIVVGISSDNKLRYDEYDLGITGKQYAKDMIEVVMPFIEKKYPVSTKKDERFLLGSSMGALISFEMLTTYPNVFSKAAGLSFPAFIHDRAVFKYLKEIKKPFDRRLFFYFDHGDYGYDEKYAPSAQEFFKRLSDPAHFQEDQVVYETYPYGDHNEKDWARRVYIPLKLFFSAN